MVAAIGMDGLRLAHNADLAIGTHPYASATAWTPVALMPTLGPAMVSANDAPMVEDWMEWCDDVFARFAEHGAEESIASSAQQVGAITDARYCDEVNVALAREELTEAVEALPPNLAAIRETTRHARSMAAHSADLSRHVAPASMSN